MYLDKFDLFNHLGQANNPEAFIYRCGYYIINQYCNQNTSAQITDSFYTIFDKMLLKFDMIQSGDIQFFNIYKIRDLTDEQILKISCFTIDLEDLDCDLIPEIIDIENLTII